MSDHAKVLRSLAAHEADVDVGSVPALRAGADAIEWRDRALALLRRVEWADNSDGEYEPRCPDCLVGRDSGYQTRGTGELLNVAPGTHASDCALAALIGGK